MKIKIVISTTVLAGALLASTLGSPSSVNAFFSLEALPYPLTADHVMTSDDQAVSVTIPAGSTRETTYLKVLDLVKRGEIANYFALPDGLTDHSDLYLVKLTRGGDAVGNLSGPVTITLRYEDGGADEALYYYDWMNLRFAAASTTRDTTTKTISYTVDLPSSRGSILIALLGPGEQVGTASWYVHPRYPTDLMAASVDFPRDTRLRVTNTANGREVVVVVKDYGPDKSVHPDRVIDLSKVAFAKIASTSAGVIHVKVVPVTD